jgi:hypothetical protein
MVILWLRQRQGKSGVEQGTGQGYVVVSELRHGWDTGKEVEQVVPELRAGRTDLGGRYR